MKIIFIKNTFTIILILFIPFAHYFIPLKYLINLDQSHLESNQESILVDSIHHIDCSMITHQMSQSILSLIIQF
jgi:hypothetical protein